MFEYLILTDTVSLEEALLAEAGTVLAEGGAVLTEGGTVLAEGGTVLAEGETVLAAGGAVQTEGGTVLAGGIVLTIGRTVLAREGLYCRCWDFNSRGQDCSDRERDYTKSRQDCVGSKGTVFHCKTLKCCWTFYTEVGADLYWQGRNCWTVNTAVGADLYWQGRNC
jgi:hypothetical protein